LKGRTCKVQNGETVLFWLDSWNKDGPLSVRYPILFELCEKEITVKKVIELGCDLNFRRWLPAILHNQWECICNEVLNTSVGEGDDTWGWKKGGNGKYSVKVMYDQLSGAGTGRNFNHIWKAKIPYKIKIFVWLIENNAI
jgi:hypothetical protein